MIICFKDFSFSLAKDLERPLISMGCSFLRYRICALMVSAVVMTASPLAARRCLGLGCGLLFSTDSFDGCIATHSHRHEDDLQRLIGADDRMGNHAVVC